jgi:hypothetical protein
MASVPRAKSWCIMPTLAEDLENRLTRVRTRAGELVLRASERQVGLVEALGSDVATIAGLAGARLDEVLLLAGQVRAMAVSLDTDPWMGGRPLSPAATTRSSVRLRRSSTATSSRSLCTRGCSSSTR